MAYFTTSEAVYDTIGKLFINLMADDELSPQFKRADTVVQYQFSEPDAVITVKVKQDEPSQVDFGETDLEPEVLMTMKADVAHRFWLGTVNVTIALARGQMKAKGPVAKILKLVPLTKAVYPRYEQQLKDDGHENLINI